MKFMRVSDLEPGDVIQFKPDVIWNWNPRFKQQVKLYKCKVEKIEISSFSKDEIFMGINLYDKDIIVDHWELYIELGEPLTFDIVEMAD